MIDKIPYDLYYIAATYLSAYDLKSLTQVSPLLRDRFSPFAWNLVYVLPKRKNGFQQKHVEYIDYRFVDEVTFANVTKYQLDYYSRESTPDDREIYQNDDLELLQNEENIIFNKNYPFIRKTTSGSFNAKYTIQLLVSSLQYLKTSNSFWRDDRVSIFDCILNDLDESVYYVHQVELNSDYDNPIIDSMETMTFPCVKALKIVNDEELVESTETKYQFKALFPNLQHLSLENIEVGEYYLNDMVASFAEGLQTLMVSVYKPAANAPFEEIITWSRDRVKKLVLSALGKHAKVEDDEIEYMVDLILDPEDIVTKFGSMDCFEWPYRTEDETNDPRLKYIMSYFYAAWESIFMKCQQLKQLEKLTIDGIWRPFLSPNFESLVCKNNTLKTVKIGLWHGIEFINLQQAKYSRFITRRVTPTTGYYCKTIDRKKCSFCHAYWVDVEGFRKQFAPEIYKKGEYEDVEYTALATEEYLTITQEEYLKPDPGYYIEEESYRVDQEPYTWDFAMHLYSFLY